MAAPRHVHLDPLGGIAGDMFLAAVLDAFPQLADGVFAAMRAAGLPEAWRADVVAHADAALCGKRVVLEPGGGPLAPCEVGYGAISRHIAASSLEPAVRDRAQGILRLLGEAEATVHGVPLEEVHFHELADWDSLADVVGAAYVIEMMGECTWSCAPVPQGSGRVNTRHGPLPVPAPATAKLLENLPVFDDGIAGERVTPTGAAILRHLAPAPRLPDGVWRVCASGFGFGTKKLERISNALRVLVYEAAEGGGWASERIGVIGFEVDDQTPEDLALGLDRLRAAPGVLDVLQAPVFGKKGRLAAHVQVLAELPHLDAVIERCLIETTTIGLRWRTEARAVLPRTRLEAEGVAVKVVTRPDGSRTAKAEVDSMREVEGVLERARRRRSAEAQALGEGDEGE